MKKRGRKPQTLDRCIEIYNFTCNDLEELLLERSILTNSIKNLYKQKRRYRDIIRKRKIILDKSKGV